MPKMQQFPNQQVFIYKNILKITYLKQKNYQQSQQSILKPMRNTNHFVIRNGKIVSKTDAQKLPQPQTQKLNIIKPAAVIVRHLQQNLNKECDSDPLNKMKQYYEGVLRKYQDRIKQLQKDVYDKNQQIQRLTKQKIIQMEGTSTAIQSRQSQISIKQQRITFDTQCYSQTQFNLKLPPPQIQNKLKTKFQQQNNYNQNCTTVQIIKKQQYISASSINFFERTNSLSSISSVASIQSVCQQIMANPIPVIQKVQMPTKTFFDTSTLMARLNKSASLVRNIKKFLQPSQQNNSKQTDQQPSSPQSNQPQLKTPTNYSYRKQIQQSSEPDSYQIQLQKFINELVQKHSQILFLVQRLSIEKDQQIKQIKHYYQDMIKKMQFGKSAHNKSYGNFNRVNNNGKISVKTWIQLEDKQNMKIQEKEKDGNKQLKSREKQLQNQIQKQRIPLQNHNNNEQNEQFQQNIKHFTKILKVQKQDQQVF